MNEEPGGALFPRKLNTKYLLGNVEGRRAVGMLPAAPEHLAQNRIVRLLEALWLLVETGQVPLDHGFHAGERIVLRNGPASAYTRKKKERSLSKSMIDDVVTREE